MTLVKVWNCEPYPLALDMQKPATLPCDWVKVDVRVADELCAGPSWSFENPRKRPERASVKVDR